MLNRQKQDMKKEMKTIPVNVGRKVEEADLVNYERGEGVSETPATEVEGRCLMSQFIMCPYCERIRAPLPDGNEWRTYTCENCGKTFVA